MTGEFSRRRLLTGAIGLATLHGTRTLTAFQSLTPIVMTVRGPITPKDMGTTLPHEHALVDFIGASDVSPDRYDRDEVIDVVQPFLQGAFKQGVRTFVDCTPAYLGRDPRLLRSLSERTGLHILTNTGYYAANGHKHLPEAAFSETAQQLAHRWIREWNEGLDATGIRPGFIKIGVSSGPLPEIDRKIVRAAALCHTSSGLTIASHTGDGAAAIEQLDILEAEGVHPSAWIWVHAQNERDRNRHLLAASRGAWVEFDGIAPAPESLEHHGELVRSLRDRGFLDRVLLSHDAGWYHVGEPGGGTFRPFHILLDDFVPRLRRSGFTEEECLQLIVNNPRAAFAVHVRG